MFTISGRVRRSVELNVAPVKIFIHVEQRLASAGLLGGEPLLPAKIYADPILLEAGSNGSPHAAVSLWQRRREESFRKGTSQL